jgi:hypothetical protein
MRRQLKLISFILILILTMGLIIGFAGCSNTDIIGTWYVDDLIVEHPEMTEQKKIELANAIKCSDLFYLSQTYVFAANNIVLHSTYTSVVESIFECSYKIRKDVVLLKHKSGEVDKQTKFKNGQLTQEVERPDGSTLVLVFKKKVSEYSVKADDMVGQFVPTSDGTTSPDSDSLNLTPFQQEKLTSYSYEFIQHWYGTYFYFEGDGTGERSTSTTKVEFNWQIVQNAVEITYKTGETDTLKYTNGFVGGYSYVSGQLPFKRGYFTVEKVLGEAEGFTDEIKLCMRYGALLDVSS